VTSFRILRGAGCTLTLALSACSGTPKSTTAPAPAATPSSTDAPHPAASTRKEPDKPRLEAPCCSCEDEQPSFLLTSARSRPPHVVQPCGPKPVPACMKLCDALCARVAACGLEWTSSCCAQCEHAYMCPGESPSQDEAACQFEPSRIELMPCRDVCATVSRKRPCE
jgi:hypothetical protein